MSCVPRVGTLEAVLPHLTLWFAAMKFFRRADMIGAVRPSPGTRFGRKQNKAEHIWLRHRTI